MKKALLVLGLIGTKALATPDVVPTQANESSGASFDREYAFTIGTDTTEAGSTNQVITATAHAARVGDLLRFTTVGANYLVESHVASTTTNTITLTRAIPAVPTVGDGFTILRLLSPSVSSAGAVTITGSITASNPSVGTNGAAIPTSSTQVGAKDGSNNLQPLKVDGAGALIVSSSSSVATHAYVTSVRNDYTSTNVTTGAWVQLIASTPGTINFLTIFDSSGNTMEIGTGAAASETRVLLIPPGGFDDQISLTIASGTRVSIRAVSGNATSGEFDLTGIQ